MIGIIAAASLFAIAAPFVLYPLVLWAVAKLASDPIAVGGERTPRVDLIICAHDEAASIGAKLENALALDYPREQLGIWVASDGSSDATVEIARRFEDRGVHVLDLPRGGKAAALIAAVEASGIAGSSDASDTADVSADHVLAFSDANSAWRPDALRGLVGPLSDERVGGVAGDQRYDDGVDHAVGERGYWSFDRQLKQWQSEAGSVISATGAIYAIRRSLFEPPPPDATDDFMISTGVVARGRRLVFAPDAVALEPPAESGAGEFRRKVRIITRGLRSVYYRRALMNPARTGIYAVELLLHKLWRRQVWIPLGILLLIAPACWSAGGVLAALSIAVVGGVLSGVVGLALPGIGRWKPVAVATYIMMVNGACALATFNSVRGQRVSHWDTERPAEPLSGRVS